jgi:hypothetical protein
MCSLDSLGSLASINTSTHARDALDCFAEVMEIVRCFDYTLKKSFGILELCVLRGLRLLLLRAYEALSSGYEDAQPRASLARLQQHQT